MDGNVNLDCITFRSGCSLPSDITLLLYGCRDSSEDLFTDETNGKDGDAVLTRVTAYSRERDEPKRYVQDLVKGEAAKEVSHSSPASSRFT